LSGRILRRRVLDRREQEIVTNTRRFLDRRMADPAVLVWAAGLGPDLRAERRAVRDSLEFPRHDIPEPVRSAWRCVVEAWNTDTVDGDLRAIQIRQDVARGVDPRYLVAEIVRIVHPRLSVELYGQWSPRPKPARDVSDLLHFRLSGQGRVSLAEVGLAACRDPAVIGELVDRLEAALVDALSWATRLGSGSVWAANYVARVYPPPAPVPGDEGARDGAGDDQEDEDPDRYRSGYAPIARLFSEVLDRLADIAPEAAAARAGRLRALDWPLTQRLWAAAARRPDIVAPDAIGPWLAALPDERFWDEDRFPEVLEMRAARFADLDAPSRAGLETRIRRGPPAALYRRGLEAPVRHRVRTEDAVRELLRLASTGGGLSAASRRWLEARPEAMRAVGEVTRLSRLYETLRYVPSEPTPAYALADGRPVLDQLQADLQGRLHIDSRVAYDFVEANADALLALLIAQSDHDAFPRVWAALAAADRDARAQADGAGAATSRQESLLAALAGLSTPALAEAADGVAGWLDATRGVFGRDARYRDIWLRTWPAAAALTNLRAAEKEAETDEPPEERLAANALNSSAGRMMAAFMTLLPNLAEVPEPFGDPTLLAMREAIVSVRGEARRQALYRLLLDLPYLRRADPAWTDLALLAPLRGGPDQDPSLWDAIARIGLLGPETLAVIGADMAAMAQSGPLSPDVRAGLAERILLSAAIALEDDQPPSFAPAEVEQMLRLGGDLVRARGAAGLARWLAGRPDRATTYRAAVAPLIREWWPRDRLARSAELSDALAPLPAAAGEAFAEAVADIAHLLTPFSAWSLFEYRLWDRMDDEGRILAIPPTPEALAALLQLLDLTVGQDEEAVVPHDLELALSAISERSPALASTRPYQRLASLVRR